jgi:uncharacterized protein (DUF488 family)
MNGTEVLTIGHSTHTIARFCELLAISGVTAIADVRSAPYSRYQPDFNRDALQQALIATGIKYVFLGKELGARPNDLGLYEDGRVQYDRLAQTELFRSGLTRVFQGAKDYRLALLCAEKEPLECHRTLLVGRELEKQGAEILHILADGRLESNDSAMTRLLALLNIPELDLFRSRSELIADACARQARRIAYVDQTLRTGSNEELA